MSRLVVLIVLGVFAAVTALVPAMSTQAGSGAMPASQTAVAGMQFVAPALQKTGKASGQRCQKSGPLSVLKLCSLDKGAAARASDGFARHGAAAPLYASSPMPSGRAPDRPLRPPRSVSF